MSGVTVVAAPDSRHPLVAAAAALGRPVTRIGPADTGLNTTSTDRDGLLVVATDRSEDPLVEWIAAAAAHADSVIVAPAPGLLLALGTRLPGSATDRIVVACAARFEPPAVAIAGSIAAGTLGLPWGVHVEAFGDARPPAEVAVDLADLVGFLTASRIGAAERLGSGQDPLVVVPELDHGILASLTILASGEDHRGESGASIMVRLDASHGQATADLLSPVLRLPRGATRFGPSGHDLLLTATLAGTAPADLRLSAFLTRLAPVIATVQ